MPPSPTRRRIASSRIGPVLVAAVALVAAGCGDDGPTATPAQRDAIATMIDAELSADEQRCVLDGLIESEISPEAIVAGDITGDEDAELLGVATSCVEDLTRIPAFVAAFMEGVAEEGTAMTEAEAICAIRHLDADDPATAVAECLGDPANGGGADGADADDEGASYGADEVLDLLWDACDGGNNQACDELTRTSPGGSGYHDWGRTCGGRVPDGAASCFDELG